MVSNILLVQIFGGNASYYTVLITPHTLSLHYIQAVSRVPGSQQSGNRVTVTFPQVSVSPYPTIKL